MQRDRNSLIELQRIAVLDPESIPLQRTLGLATLWVGNFRSAIRILNRADLPAYQAMAHVHFPGGYAKAKTTLAKAAADKSASARTLFLAALAFGQADQPEKADRFLVTAIRKAASALDEAFSPDPAVGLARYASQYVTNEDESGVYVSRIYSALNQAGRRNEVYRWAEESLGQPNLRNTALRLLVLLDNSTASKRALRRVQRIAKAQPASIDAAVAEVVLLTRLKKFSKAKAKSEKLTEVRDVSLKQALLQARLIIALHFAEEDDTLADLAGEALKQADDHPKLLALAIRAFVQTGKFEQAKTLAVTLAKKEPLEVNPYELLLEIQKKRGKVKNLLALQARSALFQKTRSKLEKLTHAREELLRSVRDSEKSKLVAKVLVDIRKAEPQLALPVDIALARKGTKGHASSARRRILAACAPKLKTILKRRTTWDQFEINASPYGKNERLRIPLSGPDPARCLIHTPRRKN
ncbi:MAG: hypothetical protein VYC39_00005 [Myxococcota bacterium]|nr:hypothetical protein [Myxococcota bacterium]